MKKALIVIDMQEGFRYSESERIIPKITKLADAFDGLVLFAAFRDRQKSMIEKLTGWKKFQHSVARKIMKEFVPKTKFWHETYTVLTPEVMRFLRKNKVETIYLCGVYTDICILKTAMDAVDHGLRVKVVRNACASLHGRKLHAAAIESLQHAIGKRHVI